jgi:hypothetical protein
MFWNIFWNQKLKIPSKFDFRLEFSDFDKIFLLWVQNMEICLWCFSQIFILLIHWSHFWRVVFWTRKVSFWGETYLHLLNNGVFAERSFENLYYTNLSKLIQESIQILMIENNKSFYPSNMFEFIYHQEYGCRNL